MNILFFGGHYWDRGPWFRKQQFASRLSKREHKVFYVEGSISMLRKKATDKNKYFETDCKKVTENLFVITPSALFPFPKARIIRKLYNKKLFMDITRIFNKYNVNEFLLWTNRIDFAANLLESKNIKILDICDDLPFYYKLAGDEKGYINTLKKFELAIKSANIIIVSAQKIKEKYQHLTDTKIIVIPNGHNVNLNNMDHGIHQEIKRIPHPRIGFLGTLFKFIDEDLLEFLVKNRPNYNFIFVGPIEGNFSIEKLKKYSNVYLMGKKPKEIVHNYVNGFDIAINPFRVHEVNDSVSPVKVFEYLALNKAVISTHMYSLMREQIAKYIEFAYNYEDFLKMLDLIVESKNYKNNISTEILMNYSWDGLFTRLIGEINKSHNFSL